MTIGRSPGGDASLITDGSNGVLCQTAGLTSRLALRGSDTNRRDLWNNYLLYQLHTGVENLSHSHEVDALWHVQEAPDNGTAIAYG